MIFHCKVANKVSCKIFIDEKKSSIEDSEFEFCFNDALFLLPPTDLLSIFSGIVDRVKTFEAKPGLRKNQADAFIIRFGEF